ncbi:glycoside hydrolase family 16 protein [Microlunatus soli]|nr:glycoside hydrolase family 16 protein [Microlunatus soli]
MISSPTAPAASRTVGPKTAAQRLGWGTPLPASDEFNYVGTPDRSRWNVYGDGGSEGGAGSNCWPGHDGNGRRCADANHVNGEYLRQTGEMNGDSAGVASVQNLQYGRWEVRARLQPARGAAGHPYHAVLITWPQSDEWPAGAEYDFFEVDAGDTCAVAFLHYPNHEPKRQEMAQKCPVDITKWHAYGFEWSPQGLTGYIDGDEWFTFNQDCIQCAPGPMHQTIQLDNFFGAGGMQRANFDIDWARVYNLQQR